MTKRNKRKLAERLKKLGERVVIEKIIIPERSDLDEKAINDFINDNLKDYKAVVGIINIFTSVGLIYLALITLNATVIVPTVIPGLSLIQNLAISWLAIISVPLWPLLYLKYIPKYRDFKKKLNEYRR